MIRKNQFFQLEEIPRDWVSIGFSLKLIAAFVLWFIYSYYYPNRSEADIFKYYDDALSLYQYSDGDWSLRMRILTGIGGKENAFLEALQHTEHWSRSSMKIYNDNPTLIRLNFILLFFSNAFYPIHALFFCFFSMTGLLGIYRFLSSQSNIPKKLIFILIFIFPSILLWSSGILKEAWLFFILGLFLQQLNQIKKKFSFSPIIGLILLGYLLFTIKPYILFCLLPGILYYSWDNLRSKKASLFKFLTTLAVFWSGIVIWWKDKFYQLISHKQDSFIDLALETNAGSLYNQNQYLNFNDLLIHLPQSIVETLYRPHIFEVTSVFTGMAAFENIALLSLLILPLFFFRNPNNKEWRVILFSLSFVLMGASIIGLSTPILGALVRYKTPLLPFYLILVLTFVEFKKMRFIRYE